MQNPEQTLAKRLGMTVHESPLRRKLLGLEQVFPSADAACLEDWLLDVANARGARIVIRRHGPGFQFQPPPLAQLSNEELVVAICQLQGLDRPQLLRLAAQLISRRAVAYAPLKLAAERERVEGVLMELARQALKVDPNHDLWGRLARELNDRRRLRRGPLLHWTRLAEPIPMASGCNAQGWRLIA